MGLPELRAVMEGTSGLDSAPGRGPRRGRSRAPPRRRLRDPRPAGIRLAQAVHHGTDHRSQICTGLTTLGIEPPEIDVWAFAWSQGRLVEVSAPSS